MKRTLAKVLLAAAAIALVGVLAGPGLIRFYWACHASNPVRRGVRRARELGCFSCHGDLGRAGLKDSKVKDKEVPTWSGGVWMMYVENDDKIRHLILNGSARHEKEEHESTEAEEKEGAIQMPPFREALRGHDLEDLTAAFHVLSEMTHPPADSPAARGYALAKNWNCFSCHGPGGSGGLPNPGSFTGFIPGWYGNDFRDMVRNRGEFDAWVHNGSIPRLVNNPVAAHFIHRQRLQMPPYAGLTGAERDDLWAYAGWLGQTDGGYRSP